MSITLTVLANAAVRTFGAMDSGGSISAAQLADALITVNEILDNWSVDGKMALAEALTAVSLVSGTQSYTLGTRAARIQGASVILAAGPTMPVKVLQSAAEWNSLEDRDSSSYLVRYLFYDRAATTPKIYLSPIPLGGSLELRTWIALTQFADATTPITLLPGYELPLRLSLAHKLSSEWDMPWSQTNQDALALALGTIQELNTQHLGPSVMEPAPIERAPTAA
jgi:hypothetical protein